MAQLPPKVPNLASNWPDISDNHHKMPSMETLVLATNNGGHSWADEFLDFSSSKCGAHRRSTSDSVAFLEQVRMVQVEQEDRRCSTPGSRTRGGIEFQHFDDEQFVAMFIDETSTGPNVYCYDPSSPSNLNGMDDDKNTVAPSHHQQIMKMQLHIASEEVKSASDGQQEASSLATSIDNYKDPKRIKRILSNRQSAQRSRVKKMQYISELELSVNSLQVEVSVLSPRVAFLDHQRLILNSDNSLLKERLAALAQDKLFKESHQEALRREIERLRQLYNHQQNLEKMEVNDTTPEATRSPSHLSERIFNHPNSSM